MTCGVALLTCGDERPRPLGTAKQGVDAGRAGANVEADELATGLIVRSGVEQALEPQYVVVPVGDLQVISRRSARVRAREDLTVLRGVGAYRRTEPVVGQVDPGAEMNLEQGLGELFDGRRVGKVELVARAEAARLSASVVAAPEMGPASLIAHGFEVGISPCQTLEVGLFCIEAAIILIAPARGGHGPS